MAASSPKLHLKCPCGTVLAVSADRAGTVVGCPKCGKKLTVPAAAAATAGWFLARNKKKLGPYSAAQLRQMAGDGELDRDDMLLREGQQQWVKAETLRGLFPEAAAAAEVPVPDSPRSARRTAEKRSGPPWLLIGVAAAVLLVFGVGGGFLLALRLSRPTPNPVAEKTGAGEQPGTTNPTPKDEKDKPAATPPDRGDKEKPTPTPPEKGGTETPTPTPMPTPGTPTPTPIATPGTRRAIDLRYIPPGAGAAVVVHPRQVLQAPLVKAALPPNATDAGQAFGAPKEMIEKVEQMIVLLHPSAGLLPAAPPPAATPPAATPPASPAEMLPPELIPLPAMIVRFGVPFDSKPVLEKLLAGATPAKHGDRAYLVGPAKDGLLGLPTAACQVDDRTVLVGPEPVLKKMLDAASGKKGPLVERLAAADGNDDLTAIVEVAPYRKALNTLIKPFGLALPPAFAALATMPDQLSGLQLTVNLRGRTPLQLAVDAVDEAGAASVEKLVQAGAGLLRESAPAWEPMLAAPGMPKPVQKEIRGLADQLLSGPEVKRTGSQVVVQLTKPARQGPLPAVADFKPYLPARAREEVELGGEVADAVVGGGGRYLIYYLKGAKKLAVFDVQIGRLVKHLPVIEEPMLFAAGARQLAVVYPAQKMLTLWGLASLEKEKTAPLPPPLAGSEIGHLCMGAASAGPVYCYLPATKHTVALDLGKMTAQSVSWKHWSPTNAYGPLSMRVSADGGTLVGRGGGWAGLEMARFQDGKQLEGSDKFAFSLGAFGNPSVDGRLILYPDGVASISGAEVQPAKGPGGYLIPAREPGIFLALQGDGLPLAIDPNPRLPKVSKVILYSNNRTELLPLTDLAELSEGSPVAWEKIVHYYPHSGLLLTLAENSKVVLRKVDLTERLAKADVDYLFVLPQPAAGKPGETFRHRPDIRSRRGKPQIKVAFGPDGLTVSPDGEIVWPIPADFADAEATVMLSITDAGGQEIAHALRITVADE